MKMAKPKSKEKSKKQKFVGASSVPKTDSLSPKEVIAQAREMADMMQPQQALHLYKTAFEKLSTLTTDEENLNLTLEVLEASAFILLEEGEYKMAEKNLKMACELSPDKGYEKYMYLAQITEGVESVNHYKRGMDVLLKSIESECDAAEKQVLLRALSNAYCAVAEIYMTDLCDEPEAESCVLESVQKASQTDETNPQSWFATARYYTVRAKNNEAKEALDRCLSLYWPRVKHVVSILQSRDEGVEDDEEDIDVLDLEDLSGIPFEGHIQMAEMMIELDMFDLAAEVLEAMLEEDNEHPVVANLLTVVGVKLWKESDPDRLRCYAELTKDLCQACGDTETVKEMEELLASLPEESDVAEEDSISIEEGDKEDEDEAGKEVMDCA